MRLLLPAQGASRPARPGRLLASQACKKRDLEWVWPRCSGKGPGVPVRTLGAQNPGPRPAGQGRTGTSRAGAGSPHSLPQRDPAQGSVLPGPRTGETHFRRVHDLPRLLLSLAAGVGAGHRDNGTGQRSPRCLADFRRTGQRACSRTVSALPTLRHSTRCREKRDSLEIPRSGEAGRLQPRSSLLAPPLRVLAGVGGKSREFVIVSRDWP